MGSSAATFLDRVFDSAFLKALRDGDVVRMAGPIGWFHILSLCGGGIGNITGQMVSNSLIFIILETHIIALEIKQVYGDDSETLIYIFLDIVHMSAFDLRN